VYGECFRAIGNRVQAGYATRDAFVDLWRMAPAFDGTRDDIDAWSVNAARRRAHDRVNAMTPDEKTDAPSVVPRPRPPDLRTHVADMLTPPERAVLDLIDSPGVPLSTVAKQLNIPMAEAARFITATLCRIRDLVAQCDTKHCGDTKPTLSGHTPAGRREARFTD
jgi:DNA-directed RNA polymerase specialized sigma24 family protein